MTTEIEKLTADIDKEPSGELYYKRANLYWELNEYDLALDDCNEAIRIGGENARYYTRRGLVYQDLSQYEIALADYDKAISMDPKNKLAYNRRGNTYRRIKRYEEALADYDRAIALNPNFAAAYYNRGTVYSDLKLYNEALQDFEKAFNLYDASNAYWKNRAEQEIKNIKAILKAQVSEKDHAAKIIEKTKDMMSKVVEAKATQNYFFSHSRRVVRVNIPEFTVLRKWNSYTPIITGDYRASNGGGYFVKVGDKGVVIDPGFNFIENFIESGRAFKEIDYVLVTHAHNDHTSDIDSLLTLLYKYNDNLRGSFEEVRDGSIVDEVLAELNLSRDSIRNNPDERERAEKEVNERFAERHKILTFYITSSTFKKYISFFELKKSINYNVVVIDPDVTNQVNLDGMLVKVIQAKHDDMISDMSAVGFCFLYEDFVLIHTGDTGFYGMEEMYTALSEEFRGKKKVLLANLGGFKEEETQYTPDSNDPKHYYTNHLGRLGLAKLVDILEPDVCVITEFGEEFRDSRVELTDIFNEVFERKTIFFPADIGFCINTNLEILAIMQPRPERNVFSREFVDPYFVEVGELEQTSSLYYYYDEVDSTALAKSMISQFYKSLIK